MQLFFMFFEILSNGGMISLGDVYFSTGCSYEPSRCPPRDFLFWSGLFLWLRFISFSSSVFVIHWVITVVCMS